MESVNRFATTMDTDGAQDGATPNLSRNDFRRDSSEEGEVTDEDISAIFAEPLPRRARPPPVFGSVPMESERKVTNRAGGFITGVDVFGKEEQARLVERAERFGLDSSQVNLLSEKELKKLYHSVGVGAGGDKEFCFDSLRLHGTEAMSTKDVFEYFKDYAPSSIEWIDDESCNVIWPDNLSAIRALLGLSKPIKNLNAGKNNAKIGKSDIKQEFKLEKIEDVDPISKSDGDDDVIMVDSAEKPTTNNCENELERELNSDPEAVDALELELFIPPGHWRKGNTHPHSDGLLLRFCRLKEREGSSQDTSKRLPQPVFGLVGLVSKSRKQRIKEGLIVRPKQFHDDMGDERDFVLSSDDEDNRNPWGTLAKSWGHIDRARQPRPRPSADDDLFGDLPISLPPLPPPPPMLLNHHIPRDMPLPPRSILNRVGMKMHSSRQASHGRFTRSRSRSPETRNAVLSRSTNSKPSGKRRRVEENSEDSAFSGSESDGEIWTRKSKVPRMRMYADEEEIKVKQRTMLKAKRRVSPSRRKPRSVENRGDLRSRLGRESSMHAVDRDLTRRNEISYHEESYPHPSSTMYSDERRKQHSQSRKQPRPKVTSVATSVWTRLAKDNDVKIKEESCSESDESSRYSDDAQSQNSESELEDENIPVMRTIRGDDENVDDEDEINYIQRAAAASRLGIDLRSKLNKKKSLGSSTSTSNATYIKPKSPLRIEIDNDEYYRQSDGEEA